MTALLDYLLAKKIAKEKVADAGIALHRVEELYGDAEPTVEEIRKVSKAFKVAARDLILPVNFDLSDRTKFRSNFNYSPDDLNYYEACLIENRFTEIASEISIKSTLPFFVDFQKTSNSAEHLSRLFRVKLIGADLESPLFDLPTILYENFKIILFTFSSRLVDGASYRGSNSAIISIAERNDIRMMYTLGHELCHLLVDINDRSDSEVWIDEDVLAPSNAEVRTAEYFANEFSACLLIPLEGLVSEIKAINARIDGPGSLTAYHIASVARKFGTSFSVAARRCENLDLIDPGAASKLEGAVKKNYKSAEIFADSVDIPRRPNVDWKQPANDIIKKLDNLFISGDLSWTRVHELLNLKIM
ncbi:ImmA/IrrE family metallo-endopeptidase [Rhizobium leguminosarum]|uniref:ImmA/IrrE family metallo-endopeptidase n=1 Tax=Rhizobium leguminosarum TaxID=384 RepID=UPI0013DB987A|nr:ImmA/IrrE family metallo-endopeptidase [Rhizobium leguminosarum]MBY5313358.1 ImmA/IrrE family metallo-endopeptidase [Rhizobium leguminosarum]NEH47346.1 ImmA/IrrE family metallo-endopeptidase [Rhizobium leguminosarum]